MSTMIDGVGLSGYRSFGNDIQLIGPFGRVNLFIGQNNSGKSNLLRFLTHHFRPAIQSSSGKRADFTFTPIDRHIGDEVQTLRVAFGVRLGGSIYEKLHESVVQRTDQKNTVEIFERLLESAPLTNGTEVAWFTYEARWENEVSQFAFSKDLIDDLA